MSNDMPDEIYLYQHFTKVSPLGCEFDIELYPAQYDHSSGVKYVRADKAVPEGWKLVPIEPTVEMLDDGYAMDCVSVGKLERAYKAMIAAAQEKNDE